MIDRGLRSGRLVAGLALLGRVFASLGFLTLSSRYGSAERSNAMTNKSKGKCK